MAEVIVTGLGGLVGSYLKTTYVNNADFHILPFTLKGITQIDIPDGVSGGVHLAGKAHDLKGKSNWGEYFMLYNVDGTTFRHFLEVASRSFYILKFRKGSS